MPRLIPLADVLKMDEGEQLTYSKGKVTKILDHITSKPEATDAWSFQKIMVKDGNAEMMLKIWDRDPIPRDWLNQTLHFSSTNGKKGLNGCKIKMEEYRGKTQKYVHVTSAASLEFTAPADSNHEAQAQEEAAAEQRAQSNLPTPPKAAATPAAKPSAPAAKSEPAGNLPTARARTEEEKVHDVKKQVFQRMNLHAICRVMIEEESVMLKEQRGITLSADEIQAYTSSLFISADKAGLFFDLPPKRLDLKPKASAPQTT